MTVLVKKTGIGQDRYDWSTAEIRIEYGVLIIYEGGHLSHAYSPGAWLEVTVEEPQ